MKVVGMDGIKPILDAIKEGVVESSSATKPRMQGSMAILMLWQETLGIRTPRLIDTGKRRSRMMLSVATGLPVVRSKRKKCHGQTMEFLAIRP